MQDKELRNQYIEKFGKRPGPHWTDEQLRQRMNTPKYTEVEPMPEPAPVPEPIEDEDTITMTKSRFREMMLEAQDEIKKEAKRYNRVAVNEWEEAKDENPIKKAHLKVYHDEDNRRGIIVDLKRAAYAKFMRYRQNKDIDPLKRDLYEVTVLFDDDKEEVIDMPLHDVALISELEVVDIIETKARKLVKKLGKIRRALKNKGGYVMSAGVDGDTDNAMLGEWVDETVTRMEETHTIRRPDGKIMVINNNRLNL